MALVLVIFNTKGFAQTAKDSFDFPYYIEMMRNDTVNFFDVQRAFYKYYANHKQLKAENKDVKQPERVEDEENDGGYSQYKRWEYYMERHINPDGSRMPGDKTFIEFNKYKTGLASGKGLNKQGVAGTDSGNWVSIGPKISPVNSIMSMGRLNAIALSPHKKGTIYVGSASGGLWASTDSGNAWTAMADGIANLGVSSIAFDLVDTNTIYIGTGDRDAGDSPGLGVFKSTDGGKTWNQSNKSMGDVAVCKLIINPTKANTILAATGAGIYLSTDGCANWKLSSINNFFTDVVFKPGNPNVVYATASGHFYRSVNGGISFSRITRGLDSATKGSISVSPNDTNCVYFVTTADQTTFSACYLSTDGGSSFRTKSTTPNILGYKDDGSDNNGQAWYDLCTIADTKNAASLYVGGVNVFHSKDSGATWTLIAHSGNPTVANVHVDQHIFVYDPFTNNLYLGNDGGIAKSSDKGISWEDLSNGLAISQTYKIGQSDSRGDLMLAGFQDNSSSQLNKGIWTYENNGDGTNCVIDPQDTLYQYDADQNATIWQSRTGFHQIGTQPLCIELAPGYGYGSIPEPGDWITPFVLDKINANVMYAGYYNLWKCANIKGSQIYWNNITRGNTDSTFIENIDQSASDIGILYYTRYDNKLLMTSDVNDYAPVWTDLTPNLPGKNSSLEEVKTDPKFPNTVYIIQDNTVYQSNNKGNSWINITGSLPSVAKNTIVLDKYSNSGMYIGTDAGVYYRDSSMTDWVPFYNGLALSARITELEIYSDSAKTTNSLIKAATYGRGTWESGLHSQVIPNIAFNIGQDSECINGNIFSFTDQSNISIGKIVKWHWNFGDATSSDLQNPIHTYKSPGTYYVNLTAINSLGAADNIFKTITVNPLPSVHWTQTWKGDSLVFHATDSLFPAKCYHWNFGSGDSANGHLASHFFPTDTNYHISLKINSPSGCNSMIDSVIKVKNPVIVLSGNFVVFIFPNPFSLSTTVQYDLLKPSKVQIVLFDVTGKQIAVLENKTISAGQHTVEIGAEEYHLSSGVYVLKFMTDDGDVGKQIVKF